ncbi:hypothetical protein FHS61_003039 [Altererythrobacter atlanticus]|uniref:Uncharacterized protein n=1 Tax=Croceibacterium atlanticum TaxID=1267766 RepID=A0A0F7KST2_9SPHN|nr:hypothetical protein [Croceibacterium atlanticum]AKH42196.1 hypothetical protein WYH_01150 [Croceibacterium atlanticum]MBB5733992.1 hypothetical protein [Croceibacterium atlanticum]
MNETSKPASRKKVIFGSIAAAAIVGVVVVGFVLPAEFGVDPTGIGKATGLVGMSEEEGMSLELQRGMAREGVLLDADATPGPQGLSAQFSQMLAAHDIAAPPAEDTKSDRFTFELLPYEGIELKYELAEGAPLLFAWEATGPLNYDMHGHPYEGGEELTESYSITDSPSQSGIYVAPFTGIHGWYWQNRTLDNVTLTLDATGAISASYTFDQAGQHDRAISPIEPGDAGDSETAEQAI